MKEITVFDQTIKHDADGRFCLNDIHKAAMSCGYASESQRPGPFMQSASVQAFIAEIESNATIPAVKKSSGRYGGTYATELVALRYAGWISAKVEVAVYQTFQKVLHANEALTHDLIERQTDSGAIERLAARAQGKVARLGYTATLKDHGVTGAGFGQCTNAIYGPLFGGTAKQLREQAGLAARANIREHMDSKALISTMFAEMVAAERIRKNKASGNAQCVMHSNNAATETRRVVDGVGI